MIKHIQIKDYKCLHDENLEIKPFTIVTGVNSAGKSSLIQSVLLPVRRIGKNGQILLDTIVNLTFDTIRNKYYNAKSVRAPDWHVHTIRFLLLPARYYPVVWMQMPCISPNVSSVLPVTLKTVAR